MLGLLFCRVSGSSWLVSLETISTCDVPDWTLSVVFSNRSTTCFGRYLAKTLPISWKSGVGFVVLWIFWIK